MPNKSLFSSHWLPIIAAALALVVVHGFGHFVYTPMLPLLVSDNLITLPEAAAVASWNYVGYLLGAMLALFLYQRALGRVSLLAMLVTSVVITILQVFAENYESLAFLRLLNGITNGVVFVLAPALVLEWLVEVGKPQHSGLPTSTNHSNTNAGAKTNTTPLVMPLSNLKKANDS